MQTLIQKDKEIWVGSDQVAVSFLSDGKTLASTDSFTTRLWDLETRKIKKVIENTGEQLAFSPDGKTAASLAVAVIGPNYGVSQLLLLDARTLKKRQELTSIDWDKIENATAMAFSPDGKILVAGVQAQVQEIRFWDTETKKLQYAVKSHIDGNFTSSLAFSPDGKTLARGGDETITLWQIGP